MLTYLVQPKDNKLIKKYIIVIEDEIVYPQNEKLNGLSLLEWIKTNPNKLKESIGKNGRENVLYVGDQDEVTLLERNLHEYYFRVWEEYGQYEKSIESEDYIYFINSMEQFVSICTILHETFKYIRPSKSNMRTFGNVNRNIIILACTEIEAQMIQILELNGYKRNRYTTKDFYKLNKIMKLDLFNVKLKYYLDYNLLEPFKFWDVEQPTKSLEWYNVYNKIKHDREKNFSLSTFDMALNSVCALYVLLIAQYGYNNVLKELNDREIFQIVKNPLVSKFNFSSLDIRIKHILMKNKIKYFEKYEKEKTLTI